MSSYFKAMQLAASMYTITREVATHYLDVRLKALTRHERRYKASQLESLRMCDVR